jgi:hypothetical protein
MPRRAPRVCHEAVARWLPFQTSAAQSELQAPAQHELHPAAETRSEGVTRVPPSSVAVAASS